MQVRCNRSCGAVAELVMACCVRAACDSRAVGRMAHCPTQWSPTPLPQRGNLSLRSSFTWINALRCSAGIDPH